MLRKWEINPDEFIELKQQAYNKKGKYKKSKIIKEVHSSSQKTQSPKITKWWHNRIINEEGPDT